MKKTICVVIFSLICVISLGEISLAKSIDIEGLVDDFQGATDLQRNQILQDNLGREISGSGIVSNVTQYDFFDTTNDIQGIYYQITTQQQKTKNNIPYQLILLYKNEAAVRDINKGEAITKDGKIIRVEDERLQIAVWLLCGDLTDKDKLLFRQD